MVDPEQPKEGAQASDAGERAGEKTDEESDPTRDAVVAARFASLAARYGSAWDEGQREQVRANIERKTVLAGRLRRTPLTNADEPEIVFVPYRGDEG